MIYSKATFDVTSTTALLSSEAGYKYEIYGWAFHSNSDNYNECSTGIDFTVVKAGQPITNLYGEYNAGAGATSYAGNWQLPIRKDAYFEVGEGWTLYIIPPSSKRLSGVIWYKKVSTSEATTTPLLMLMGVGT